MATDSPATTTGSGGRLATEFCIKADLGGEGMLERTLSKRDDLRVSALENYATQKANNGDGSPLIGARRVVHSPNKTTSTIASDTVLGADLQRQGSATLSSGAVPRASRSRSPVKRSTAAVLESYEDIVRSSQEDTDFVSQGSEEPCGLDFLLQACEILEPAVNGKPRRTVVRKTLPSAPPPERTQPARARRVRRNSEEDQYTQMESSEEEDYRPVGRGRAVRKPSAKAAAAAADGCTGNAPMRWERGMVTGPCTNPDCEHPYDSPQWRKGPAQFPILCNACGTRWLRNGTLKPLVPRRGIRYSKPRPRTARAPPQSLSRGAAYQDDEEEVPAEQQPMQRSRRYMEPSEEQAAPSMSELYNEQAAMASYRHPMAPAPAAPAAAGPMPADALAAAMASIPGFSMPMFFHGAQQHADFNGGAQQMHMDPALMQHQLMAMHAAQQFMTAMTEAANAAKMGSFGLPSAPVIHMNAVAGPAVPAPMFVQQQLSGQEDAQMADA